MNSQSNIDKHSKVTISLAATILVFIVGLAVSGVAEYDATRAQIAELQKSQWTVNNQLRWVSELQKENPSLNVPIPDIPFLAMKATLDSVACFTTNQASQ